MLRLLVASAVALCLACGGSAPAPTAARVRVPVGDSPQRGPGDAWVTIVEFADFECPYCRVEEPVLQAITAAYGSDVRVVFKHFPLGFHPDAWPAAIAAECARAQGRFWEMHDGAS